MSSIPKRFTLALRVVQYPDRIQWHVPRGCPVQGPLPRVTQLRYLLRPPAMA